MEQLSNNTPLSNPLERWSEGADLVLYDILSHTRAHNSKGELHIIDKYIRPIADEVDDFGNLYKRIGTAPVPWSCHTDSVHSSKDPVKQTIYVDEAATQLFKGNDKMCLGADCGTGIWLMLQMIEAGVEGLYIFHRQEETGGKGSDWIALNRPDLLKSYQQAIAFDRYGTDSIITHQSCSRCASDNYGLALADLLGMNYKLDTGGSFTDTANYATIIPECTNISVGYYNQHTNNEYQDLVHLTALCNVLCDTTRDFAGLPIERDPSVIDDWFDDFRYSNYSYHTNVYESPLLQAIIDYPETIAEMLRSGDAFALDDDELARHIEDRFYTNLNY